MKPLLTVVIPVYNVEKYLNRCLKSILVQELANNTEKRAQFGKASVKRQKELFSL